MSVKVAMLMCDGFEEIEAITVVDVLRRAEIEIDLVGLKSKDLVGSHGIHLRVDKLLSEVSRADYRGIILPGGLPGSHTLRDDEYAQKFIKSFEGSLQAAICAAPVALYSTGVLDGVRVTSHPSKESELINAVYSCDRVVRDGQIITSRGAGTAFEFASEILNFVGKRKEVEALKLAMLY